MVLGEGHSPVNYPINARSASDRETRIVSSGGRATSGTSSIRLTNFGSSLLPKRLAWLVISLSKASNQVGKDSSPTSSTILMPHPLRASFNAWIQGLHHFQQLIDQSASPSDCLKSGTGLSILGPQGAALLLVLSKTPKSC